MELASSSSQPTTTTQPPSLRSSESRELKRKPKDTAFLQQRLKAQHPLITPRPFIIGCLLIGIIFIPIGVSLVVASNGVVEKDIQYDQHPECAVGKTCTMHFNIPQKMSQPVYLYYRLDGFYQNHRRYVQSRSDEQLNGKPQNSYSDLSDCDPEISANGSTNPKDFYFPCGLIAKSMFNDTFFLYDNNSKPISMQKTGIAWSTDRQYKFQNPPSGTLGIRTIPDLQDEDFIVWMRTAALPDFKKLYRIINQDMEGNYFLKIHNYYPVYGFGSKYVVFSTMSWAGGQNPFMGYAFIVMGAVAILQGVIFSIKQLICPRPLGDLSYLHWD